jgi:hypothetical protein
MEPSDVPAGSLFAIVVNDRDMGKLRMHHRVFSTWSDADEAAGELALGRRLTCWVVFIPDPRAPELEPA